ncbi:MAG: 50S ribosomal protein L18 [Rickettsiales bacterium]|jgi:large subunit ribosomal protein L18|nr:50S ribosomal protein L18 [Rickettsiales bacterium]|tara:strand:+ start:202 stop:558 length:357 start_codon:yes stop_codon:yes gene_type:complete
MQKKIENINRRKLRNRFKVKKSSVGVPRLSVFRSARHIFGQIIDDTVGKTLVQASTLEQDLRKKTGGNIEAAQIVGKLLAQRAKDLGIKKVVFDRGSYLFHGRVKALATSARAEGLIF